MDGSIRFGVLLPTRELYLNDAWSPRHVIDYAVHAERLGYASVWAGDSLSRQRIEPITVLAALATATERVELGTAVLIPHFRQPLNAATAIASFDLLNGGRTILGVGAGYPGLSNRDFELVGVPYRNRFTRLDEIIALWRKLWSKTSDEESFEGTLLQLPSLPDIPKPHRPGGPPVWIAGATPAALARTGRLYDGWMPYPPAPADFTAGLDAIHEAARDAGRDPAAITPSLYATVLIDDDEERGRRRLAEYCDAFYELPIEFVETVQMLIAGPASRVIERLSPYIEAGARHIVIRVASLTPNPRQLEEIAAHVLRHPWRVPAPAGG